MGNIDPLLGKRIACPGPALVCPSSPRRRRGATLGATTAARRAIWDKCGLTPHFVGSALGGLPQNASFAVPSARFTLASARLNR